MDTTQMARNQVSYIFSREVILKKLLQEGIISDSEFDLYNQLLYDRYQMDASTGIPRPGSLTIPEAQDQEFSDTSTEYISLTTEAKAVYEDNPGYAVQSWLRDSNTIAFLHYWELKNNINFDSSSYEALIEELKAPSATLTTKKWIEATNAIGLRSKQGKNGGTYAHPEIACAFRAWLRPEFQYSLVQSFLATHRGWRTPE